MWCLELENLRCFYWLYVVFVILEFYRFFYFNDEIILFNRISSNGNELYGIFIMK